MTAQDNAAKEPEYRGHADRLRAVAEQTQDPVERATLQRMADAWIELANRMKDLREGRSK